VIHCEMWCKVFYCRIGNCWWNCAEKSHLQNTCQRTENNSKQISKRSKYFNSS